MATKKKKVEKYRCSCGCNTKVDRVTERRHLNPEQAPLYARIAQHLKDRAGRTGQAAQKLWQQAIDHLSPRLGSHSPQQSSFAKDDARVSPSPLVPGIQPSAGSPMPLCSPALPHTPEMSSSPRQIAEAALQYGLRVDNIPAPILREEEEHDSGESSAGDSDELHSNENSDLESLPVDDEEDLARMQELWEEYDRLSHKDTTEYEEQEDEDGHADQDIGQEGEDCTFWSTVGLPNDLRALIAHLSMSLHSLWHCYVFANVMCHAQRRS